jgi:RNase H-fold protein (predicted Holliday junction resolvase)
MPETSAETLLAVDPGRAKCGVAVVSGPDPMRILSHMVVDAQHLTLEATALRRRFPEITRVIIGDGTGSAVLRGALTKTLSDLPIESVPEHGTSARARTRFLAENPALGWRRILLPGLRAPERAYDDYVALILAEAYFSKKK